MGQAKNRGSLQDRINQSKERGLHTQDVATSGREELYRLEHKLPADARFYGYGIMIGMQGFVGRLIRSKSGSIVEFATEPKDTLMFETFEEAEEISRELSDSARVGAFFEVDGRVTFLS